MFITTLGLTLAILACQDASALDLVSCSAASAVDVHRQDTATRTPPPDSVPRALIKALGTVSGKPFRPGAIYVKDIVIVDFDPGTSAAARQATFDAVGGVVVGGRPHFEAPSEGAYYVRVRGGTASSLLHAVIRLQALPQVGFASMWDLTPDDLESSPRERTDTGLRKGIAADRWTSSNRPATRADTIAVRPVPAHAPDSIPQVLWDSLTAPENLMTNPPGMRGRWARNVMMITFQRTATQPERQAGIDLIHGEVLGGNQWPGGDGEYIVRIPYATAPGDSISGPVIRAFLALRGHPSIAAAYPLSMDNLSKSPDRSRASSKSQAMGVDTMTTRTVPAQAPDSISSVLWDSLTAPGNLMVDMPHLPRGPWVKNLMLVTFKPTATQADRETVIALIHGEIVGGSGEGQYVVRIPYALHGDSTAGPVLRAFRALNGHPAVQTAYPVGMFNPNVLYGRATPASAPLLPPDSVPHALFDSLGTVMTSIPGIEPGPYRRDIVVVRFEPETPLAARMAVIDSIAGHVVGGHVDDDRQNGSYYVRISGGTFNAIGDAVDILQRQPQVSNAYPWGLFIPDIQSERRTLPTAPAGAQRPAASAVHARGVPPRYQLVLSRSGQATWRSERRMRATRSSRSVRSDGDPADFGTGPWRRRI